jgi:hypothetical protein
MGIIGEADRRPQHEAALVGDEFLQIRIAVVGRGLEIAAERRFRIIDQRREKRLPVEPHIEGLIIGDEFRE